MVHEIDEMEQGFFLAGEAGRWDVSEHGGDEGFAVDLPFLT
jgi:hypothetical protein